MRFTSRQYPVLVLFLAAFLIVALMSAWMCDDAYITFRTVDNFVHGYGLRWNAGERVQAYTHPLWMFLNAAIYCITGEIYYSNIALSLALSLAALALLAHFSSRSFSGACLAILAATLSKGFIDFTTSGMENPLTHFLLILYFAIYFAENSSPRRILYLSFAACAASLNRLDLLAVVLPPLLAGIIGSRRVKSLLLAACGFIPLFAWEIFSLFYYGFPFPNTAYAKLNTGIPAGALIVQGLHYLGRSIAMDPLTLLLIAAALAVALANRGCGRRAQNLPIVTGLILYLLYVVKVGGDFMSGRFLTPPFLLALILIARSPIDQLDRRARWACFLLVIFAGLASPVTPVFSGPNVGAREVQRGYHRAFGVKDERASYYEVTGLLRAVGKQRWPDFPWIEDGRRLREHGGGVHVFYSIGFAGFYAGPEVHIVDENALADPLLARIKIVGGARNIHHTIYLGESDIIIGHFKREIPEGYLETLRSGENRLADPNLAAYYDVLSFVTRGPLFDLQRLKEICKLNLGLYDHYLEAYLASTPAR